MMEEFELKQETDMQETAETIGNEAQNLEEAEIQAQSYTQSEEAPQASNGLKSSSFYSENYTKPKKKKMSVAFQMVIVAVISSILGGSIVGGFLMFVAPAVQPTVKSYFGALVPNSSTTASKPNNLTKVEIQKSETPVTAIAEKVGPAIVGIRVSFTSRDSFFGAQPSQGEGSGIILSADGYIVTNNHVIADAVNANTGKLSKSAKVEVFLPSEVKKSYTAQLVGRDQKTDLAVLKIDATGLPAAELGDSDALKVGEMAVAIGNPGGLEYMGSVTVGVISGLNRTIAIENNGNLKLIQTDAAINPGNSGGALVNSQGQVIGINSAKIAAEGFEGVGFAIPINKVKEITNSLMTSGYVKGRPLLGVSIDQNFDEEAAAQYGVPAGLHIVEVVPFSGASEAGLKVDDIITKFDGVAVKTFNAMEDLKNKHKPGDTVVIEAYRYSDKTTHSFKVVLGENKQ